MLIQNSRWNTIISRRVRGMNAGYDHNNHNIGVTKISYSLRLVLEGNTNKEIPEIRVFRKYLSKQLCLIICRRQHIRTIKRRSVVNLPLLRTLLAIHQNL